MKTKENGKHLPDGRCVEEMDAEKCAAWLSSRFDTWELAAARELHTNKRIYYVQNLEPFVCNPPYIAAEEEEEPITAALHAAVIAVAENKGEPRKGTP